MCLTLAAGTGEPRPIGDSHDAYDPLGDCFVIRDLPAGQPFVLASAAYDKDGKIIGAVGATSFEARPPQLTTTDSQNPSV